MSEIRRDNKGRKLATGESQDNIHSIRGVVRPAFQMAVDDDLIRKNPFEFQLATVVVNDSVTREAITRKQQREFLRFIKEDKHFCKYYDGIYILFNTGLRVSEFVGLTVNDIEFDKQRINIDHQLQRTRNMEYEILTPKTEKGERRDEKGCGLKGLKIAQYLAQTKEKLCKVIPKYTENVNKNIVMEILQNCCKCRKYSKIKHIERF